MEVLGERWELVSDRAPTETAEGVGRARDGERIVPRVVVPAGALDSFLRVPLRLALLS